MKWQPTPVFLLGKSHGQRSQVGHSAQSCKELDMNERLDTKQTKHKVRHGSEQLKLNENEGIWK